jgi:hypothetical protein
MRRSTLGAAVALALTTAALDVRADPLLTVSGHDELPECPNAAELLQLVTQTPSPATASATHSYRVSFERTTRGHKAEIVDQTTHRTRRLEDASTDCAPLGRAVSLALVTMWGAEQEAAQAPPVLGELPPPRPPLAPPPPQPQSPRWLFGAGSGIAVGIVRESAPAIVADSGFERGHASGALGALWIPLQTLTVGPGSVDVQLLAGSARGCACAFEPVRAGICARVLGGAMLGRSSGYDSNGEQARPWFALGLETFVDGALPLPLMRYRLTASVIAPLSAEAFVVQNVGAAYRPPAIGALFTLALEIEPR